MIAWIVSPLGMLLAGPLADFVFEPAMMAGGRLAGTFNRLVGTGPGAGMALILIISGLGGALVGVGGYLFPSVRYAEDILPDHELAAATANATADATAAGSETSEAATI